MMALLPYRLNKFGLIVWLYKSKLDGRTSLWPQPQRRGNMIIAKNDRNALKAVEEIILIA